MAEHSHEWEDDAACLEADPELFFPSRIVGESNRGNDGKAWCSRCPVMAECLQAAIVRREKHGLWGGAGEPTRRRIGKLTRPQLADQHPDDCTCAFCIAVRAHTEAVTRAYTDEGTPAHGRWEAYVHAGCRCRDCSEAHRVTGRLDDP